MTESPDNTRLTTPSGTITDSHGSVWKLQQSTVASGNGLQIVKDGKLDTITKNVMLLCYSSRLVWQKVINAQFPDPGRWFTANTNGSWVDRGNVVLPKPTVPSHVVINPTSQNSVNVTWVP